MSTTTTTSTETHQLTKTLTEWSCSCGRRGVLLTTEQREELYRCPAQCQFELEVPGPHPGCAEFAAPDVVVCRSSATHRTTLRDEEPAQYADVPVEWLLCDEHTAELLHDVVTGSNGAETLTIISSARL